MRATDRPTHGGRLHPYVLEHVAVQAQLVGHAFDDKGDPYEFTMRHRLGDDRYGIEVRTRRPHPQHPPAIRDRTAWRLLAHAVTFRTGFGGDGDRGAVFREVRERVMAIPAAPTVVEVDGQRLDAVVLRDKVSRTWVVGLTTTSGDHVGVVGTGPLPEAIRLRQVDLGENRPGPTKRVLE